jgi:hypothetical protein
MALVAGDDRLIAAHQKAVAATLEAAEAMACANVRKDAAVTISDKGPFAYDSNTPSGTISGYLIDCDGDLTLLNTNGILPLPSRVARALVA